MYSHYEKSRIPFSYVLYAYSVKRAYRGTKPKESFLQNRHIAHTPSTTNKYIQNVHTTSIYVQLVRSTGT